LQALTLLLHGDTAFLGDLTAGLVQRQGLVASGTSEKGLGGDVLASLCAIETDGEGGLRVAKESPNISYMDHAQAALVTAMRPGPRERQTQVLVAAETHRMELDPGPETAMMGMRGILNRPYRFTARFEEAAILRETYPAIARATMTPSIHVLWAALWSGLAASSLAKARAFVAARPAKDAASELISLELSRLVDRHYVLNAMIRDAVRAFDQGEPAQAMSLAQTARAKRLKAAGSALAQEICIGALGLIGLPAYAETGPYSLSQIVRDVLSAPVMVSNHRLLLANAPLERFIEEGL